MTHNDAERFSRLLAQRLESLAREKGVSQNRLSKESGVSQSQISRIFSFDRSVSVDQLSAIAETLGVSPWEIVKEAEEALRAPLAEVRDLSELRARVEAGQVGDVAALDPGYSPEDEQEPESP